MAHVPEIFPQDNDTDVFSEFDPDDDVGLLDTESEEPEPYGFTWAYDFNAEDLDFSTGDPLKVYELGTVNEWIMHTINTEQFETPIFGPNIGTDINDLIGDILDSYVLNRVTEEIEVAIAVHDRIDTVEYILAFSIKGNVYCYFAYETDDSLAGQGVIEVG